VLGLLTVITLGALLRGGGRLYFGPAVSDLTEYFYPHAVFFSRWLKQGGFPYWDPHAFGGYPVVETQQSGLLYLPSLLSVWVLSPESSMGVQMAIHAGLALGLGYLAFRKGLRLTRAGAVFATATYVYGAAFATRVTAGHFTVAAACGWYPLGVASAVRTAGLVAGPGTDARRWRLRLGIPRVRIWFLLGAAACAATILAGAPQYVVYLVWMQVAAVASWCPWRRWTAAGSVVVAMWAVAALLSAPQWLPAVSYLPHTGRNQMPPHLYAEVLDQLTLPVELFLPAPLGNDLGIPHVHKKNVWETATYPGVAVVALSLAALARGVVDRRKRSRRQRVAFAVVALGLYLCLGGALPGLGAFREPMKARIVLGLGLSLCAAGMLEQLSVPRPGARGRRRMGRLSPATATQGALAICLVAAWGIVALFRFTDFFPRVFFSAVSAPLSYEVMVEWLAVKAEPPRIMLRMIPSAVWVTVTSALLFGILAWSRRNPGPALAAVFLVGILDPVIRHLPYYYSTHSFASVNIPDRVADFLKARADETRRAGEPPWRVTFPNPWTNRGHLFEYVYETGGYDPLMPAEANLRNFLLSSETVEDKRTLRGRTAEALGRRFDFGEWNVVSAERRSDMESFRVSQTADLASVVRTVQAGGLPLGVYGPSLQGLHFVVPGMWSLKEVQPEDLDETFRKEVAAIARHDDESTTPILSGEDEGGTEFLFMEPQTEPGRYIFRVGLKAPGLFLLRTTWLPGWRVQVDEGTGMQPWLADNWKLAAPLEKGEHRVTFTYRPVRWRLSLGIAAVTWVLLAAAAIRALRKRRSRKA